MGGDFAPEQQVKGAVLALKRNKDFVAVLCGDEEKVKAELAKYKGYDETRVEIVHAPEVITNDDIPTKAVKTKKDSSTVTAFRLVKEGNCDGLVSSGSTGAVLAAGVMMLGRIKGISRPALCPRVPNALGGGTLLCGGDPVCLGGHKGICLCTGQTEGGAEPDSAVRPDAQVQIFDPLVDKLVLKHPRRGGDAAQHTRGSPFFLPFCGRLFYHYIKPFK
jgi:hypothetical protein